MTAEVAEHAEKSNGKEAELTAINSREQPSHVSQEKERKQSNPLAAPAFSAVKASPAVKTSPQPFKRPMPTSIHPMLATSIEEPFDGPDWLFEIKWDGYRAVAFIDNGKVRLVSRNQNELTHRYPELKDLPQFVNAKHAILDGEVVALDEQGRPSFSLMQQRTGFRPGGKRGPVNAAVPVLYYAFDLLYLDGYDWRKVRLEARKDKLKSIILSGDALRYSDHSPEKGKALFELARERGLEGIVAKKRECPYQERRSSDWLKIKIRRRVECVIGGYTEPEGSRAYFGSIVLGLYDGEGRLVHVGQAGSGFTQKSLAEIWQLLRKRETKTKPFYGEVEALRKVNWIKPDLVAEIEYTEWTEGASGGSGPKLRAPVFLGLRDDKDPKECLLKDAAA